MSVGSLSAAIGAEIREELAQQLEQGYEEALAAGAGETEAAARALAQMGDWELLAAEIADAELGAVEPVADRPAAGCPGGSLAARRIYFRRNEQHPSPFVQEQ